MAKKVSPHNKLRPPKLCTNKNVCADHLLQNNRTELSYASYNAYIWKYREAFKMCARAGVPQYTTLFLGDMKTELVYMVGQSFLFLAGVFAFTWSYMIARYITVTKEKWLRDGPISAKTSVILVNSESHAGSAVTLAVWKLHMLQFTPVKVAQNAPLAK